LKDEVGANSSTRNADNSFVKGFSGECKGRVVAFSGIIVLALVLGLGTYPLVSQMPAGLIPDDGYFYATIARHIATDHFSSFDGIHPTDGYHQLWEYLLAGVAFLLQPLHPSRTGLLQSFLIADFVLLLASAWLAGRNVLERIFVFLCLVGCQFLMEGHLLALLIACVAIGLLRSKIQEPPLWVYLCCGLIPLARIDATVIPLGIAIGIGFGKQRWQAVKLAGWSALGVGVHFVLMLLLHHHLFSVSSAIKSGAASLGLRIFANLGQRTPTLPIPLEPQGVFVVLLAVVSLVLLLRSPQSASKPVLVGLWLGTALFTFAHLCFSDVHPWYYAAAFVGFPVVFIWCRPAVKFDRFVLCGAAPAFLLVAALCAKAVTNRKEAGPVREFVARVNEFDSANQPIYMVDGSGYWGYWADAPVINGDGLVNSHEYAARLKKNDLADYLAENHTSLVMTNKALSPDEPLVDIGGLRVGQDQAVKVLTKAENGRYFFTNFVLWRVKG
jgi:hypothetical protein